MKTVATRIDEVKILVPEKFEDDRGFLSETFRREVLAELGIEREFVQENHSMSAAAGTVRALHFQLPPFAQDKLVRVVRGAILDVAVDLRRSSPTFGEHVAVRVSAEEWNQVLIPAGFAHGFCTLEPNTEVLYKVTSYYAPEYDRGLLWNDPELGIDWPVKADEAAVSPRDQRHPRLRDLPDAFE